MIVQSENRFSKNTDSSLYKVYTLVFKGKYGAMRMGESSNWLHGWEFIVSVGFLEEAVFLSIFLFDKTFLSNALFWALLVPQLWYMYMQCHERFCHYCCLVIDWEPNLMFVWIIFVCISYKQFFFHRSGWSVKHQNTMEKDWLGPHHNHLGRCIGFCLPAGWQRGKPNLIQILFKINMYQIEKPSSGLFLIYYYS